MRQIRIGDFRIGNEEKEAINEILGTGHISEGVKVNKFEKLFAEYTGTKYAIALSSGTAALIAGLTALKYHKDYGIKNNSRIITTPLTYIATSNAIVLSGFEPVYVDVDKETFGITPENIKTHLEQVDDISKYSLILPVHLLGYPNDMSSINKIAKKYGLNTFEDSSEAHGTMINGGKTGSMSLLSSFSFYIAHNIQVGEMGAITTDDFDLIKLIRKIKANGRMCDCTICTRKNGGCPKIAAYTGEDDFDPRFTHEFIGYNFKTMEFQAALGITQLKKADWIIKRRLENVKYLNDGLEKHSDMLKLPKYDYNISYMGYPLVIKDTKKLTRKYLRTELEKQGIETRPLFGCIPTQQPAYAYLKNKYTGLLPNAEYLGSNAFYLGCHQYLEQADLDHIITAFDKILSTFRGR